MNDQRSYVDIYSAVPQELKERRQWVMWRWAKREGEDKPTKPPYKPTSRFLNRQKAKNNDPYTWTDFQSVCKPQLSDTPCFGVVPKDYDDRGTECGCVFSGIGYVFSEDDPYCGIDLDDCLYRDENGKIQIKSWAQPIVDMLTPLPTLRYLQAVKASSFGFVASSPMRLSIKFTSSTVQTLSKPTTAFVISQLPARAKGLLLMDKTL